MRTLIVAAAIVCALLTPSAADDDDVADLVLDTPGCASRKEYDNLTRFLSVGQVAGRFDTKGIYLGSGPNRFRRGYDACWTNQKRVVVWYKLSTGLSDAWAVKSY